MEAAGLEQVLEILLSCKISNAHFGEIVGLGVGFVTSPVVFRTSVDHQEIFLLVSQNVQLGEVFI